MDESKPASSPGGAIASGAAAQPAPSTAPKRPDTGLSLMGTKLPNGEAPEDAIDRFVKLADEALARGDKGQFEFFRNAAKAVASWVAWRLNSAEPYIVGPPRPLSTAEQIERMAWADAFLTWHHYRSALATWRSELEVAPPAPAPGAVEAEPTPAPAQSAAPGEKSATAVEKSNQKAQPGDKTPSGTAAYPEKDASHVTIIFKVEESVLQGGSQGEEIGSQLTKLTAIEPALPKTGQTKTAKAKLDKDHDRSPVTCTTGADGRCKAQLPADERDSYGLPALPSGASLREKLAAAANGDPLLEFFKTHSASPPSENYSVGLAPAKSTGVVIQKGSAKLTSAQLALLGDAPPGVQVEKSDFRIGDRTYMRVSFTGPAALTAEAARKFSDSLGKEAQIDQCGEKAPGPPLGMTPVSLSALNNELPQATVDLHRAVQPGGARR